MWKKSHTFQTLWCRASFWNWDAVDGTLRSNFLLIPAIPLHGLASVWGHPLRTIPSAVTQLIRLVAEAGEELVGLCYFGDQQSREGIEMWLARTDPTIASTTPPRRSSPSEEKH